MPTTYAEVADVARELKPFFAEGFSDATDPTVAEIEQELADASVGIRVRVTRRLGAEPATGSDGARLAKRGAVAIVCAWVLRRGTLGNAAQDVEALAKPFEDRYRDTLKAIDLLPDLFASQPVGEHRVGSTKAEHQRAPLLADDALSRTDTW